MKLLYLVTEDSYFLSHRLPMAQAAREAGFETVLVARISRHRDEIEKCGIRVIPLTMERRSLNPFRALGDIASIRKIYKQEKPDVVHHIAMKPVLFGSIAAWRRGVPRVVNAFAGLGYVFASRDLMARMLRIFLVPLFRFFLKRRGSFLLLQNEDDRALLRRLRMAPESRTVVIPGSGIDTDLFPLLPLPDKQSPFICVYAGRMIGIKGLQTLKEAFAILSRRSSRITLWLCGRPDDANPGSWSEDSLRQWERESGNVVYKGHCPDMRTIWAQAHVAVQASYGGEGVPKSLLEAASCARPIVASDVPGCREMVDENINGLLVPSRDAPALAEALLKLSLMTNDTLSAMGAASRDMISRKGMSAAAITARTKEFYLQLVADEGDKV